ncbi:dipicolinate synthase subunit B [Caproiciproducens galactitolivorans]|uniref:Dipicolinate synthase subunit B n=1 Tax=Caproiciproducens galactitolivorans TaxID=642589 RepID=A0A4Z0YF24_9FIRM|nr:dipicolinate synthase subunit B [Caproiciproducens galactitolivorans]QEY35785.1 dipicolinate synthase subunit B [Caproiciproducens galactitolivorans]TGJ77520.1 dipicolinate synthase subunit B [Caproiciproducens galactitolivorans]
MDSMRIGYALCGSFCTFSKAIEQMRGLAEAGYAILPIMSQNAASTDTRFGKADDFIWEIEDICGRKVLKTIVDTEPIGPKKMLDLLIVAPCTGNTLAKIANGITDTSVTMAVKSHLRIGRPVLLAPATNDALAASAQNIGRLLNCKNIYFVPMRQDDPENKPSSVVADFSLIPAAALCALEGRQMQPVLLGNR